MFEYRCKIIIYFEDNIFFKVYSIVDISTINVH